MSAFISLLSNGTLRVFILAENCRETFLLINYKSDYNFGKIFGTLHFHMHFCSCGSAFNAHHLWMHTYCNSSQTSSPVTKLTCFWGRTEHFRWKVTSLHPNECEWWDISDGGRRRASPAGGAGEGEWDQLVPERLILWDGVWTNQSADALALWQLAQLTGVCTHRPRNPPETSSEPHHQQSKTWRIMGEIHVHSCDYWGLFFSHLRKNETGLMGRHGALHTHTHLSLLSTHPLHTHRWRAIVSHSLMWLP